MKIAVATQNNWSQVSGHADKQRDLFGNGVAVARTRKNVPGTKALSAKAAKAGADFVVTSSPYTAPPKDVQVNFGRPA